MTMNNSDWIPVPKAGQKYCKFCRQLVYWKKQERRLTSMAMSSTLHHVKLVFLEMAHLSIETFLTSV